MPATTLYKCISSYAILWSQAYLGTYRVSWVSLIPIIEACISVSLCYPIGTCGWNILTFSPKAPMEGVKSFSYLNCLMFGHGRAPGIFLCWHDAPPCADLEGTRAGARMRVRAPRPQVISLRIFSSDEETPTST